MLSCSLSRSISRPFRRMKNNRTLIVLSVFSSFWNSTVSTSTSYRRAVASRATPAHQCIFCAGTVITTTDDLFRRVEATKRENAIAREAKWGVHKHFHSVVRGLNESTLMEPIQLVIGTNDCGEFLDDIASCGSRDDEIQFVVFRPCRRGTDAAEIGCGTTGPHHGGNRRNVGRPTIDVVAGKHRRHVQPSASNIIFGVAANEHHIGVDDALHRRINGNAKRAFGCGIPAIPPSRCIALDHCADQSFEFSSRLLGRSIPWYTTRSGSHKIGASVRRFALRPPVSSTCSQTPQLCRCAACLREPTSES